MRTPALASLLLLLAACGSLPPDPDADAGTQPMDAGPSETSVEVTFDGGSQVVELLGLPTAPIGDQTVVLLDGVLTRAFPSLDVSQVQLGFLAFDGFDPASKANCQGLVPVPGANLHKGGIIPQTRNLQWEDSLQYPGCLYVHGTVKLIVTTP